MKCQILLCVSVVVLSVAFPVGGEDGKLLYVKWDASGRGDGSSWDNAFDSIGKALAAAEVDSVIYVSGGPAGHTYEESAIIEKSMTLKGSMRTGHSGRVTWAGQKIIENTTGVVRIQNMDFTVDSPDQYPLVLRADSASVFEGINLEGVRTLENRIEVWGGTATFIRCRFADQYQSSYKNSRGFKTHGAASSVNFDYCMFDYGAGTVDIVTPGSIWEFVNCLFAMPDPYSSTTHAVRVGDDPGIRVTFVNSVFLGNYPVRSGTSSTGIFSSNCFWHQTAGPGLFVQSFDFANVAVVENDLTNINPYFLNSRNSRFGAFVIRVDDMGNSDEARQGAEILNPEVVVTFYTNGHSRYRQGYFSITEERVEDWRYLVNHGNEVGGHGSTHSGMSDMSAIMIHTDGGDASIRIQGRRTGDSSTWRGILTLKTEDVSEEYDLVDERYDTFGELVGALDGTELEDVVLTARMANVSLNSEMISTVLTDVTDADISEDLVLMMDEAAFVRFEIRENIEDIHAYIRTGLDRNGANPCGAGPAEYGSAAETYTMHSFATASGDNSPSVLAELRSDPNIWGASTATPQGNHSGNIYQFGASAFSLYGFLTDGIPDGPRIFAQALGANVSSHVIIHTWHRVPQYDDGTGSSASKLKDLCLHFNVGGRTFSDILYHIRTSGDWTISSGNAIFTGEKTDYLMTGYFALTRPSLLIDMGIEQGQIVDYGGNPILDIPDIGIYEFQK